MCIHIYVYIYICIVPTTRAPYLSSEARRSSAAAAGYLYELHIV